ncbi:MAG TPA: hypothetical protein VI911_02405 [Patescibacteria group bacterium]|nr:hypothetical protein [Patescibacteria group bacterium]
MKNVILAWNPKIGDNTLEVVVEFPNKATSLAVVEVTPRTIKWTVFPGLAALPETTDKERDLVETHVRTYYDAFFRLVKETTIWYDDSTNVEAKIQKSI